jgi:GxxExxY protein
MLREEALTRDILGAAIEVHRVFGPGLLESAYETALCHELHARGITFQRQIDLPIKYKGVALESTFRMDLLVRNTVIVELKSVEKTLPIHASQLLTYLRLSGYPIGLLINFNVPNLRNGIIRRVL